MKKIAVLGCGWLGFPLAKMLIKNGNTVNGSTTTLDKIILFENEKINAFQIIIGENEILGGISDFLNKIEILIIDIPPKLRGVLNSNQREFVQKMENLIPYIEKSTVRKVLFASSTSVYYDNNSTVTEASIAMPETEAGKQLLQVELLLKKNNHFKTTVLRFGGLVGENRHPIHFLAGQKGLENPQSPINLIHQEDCIAIILKIIKNEIWGETFNAVAPFHPSRAKFYTQKAIDLNLPLPEFDLFQNSIGKIVSSQKIETILNYKFLRTVDL
jgi:nucleoside-diphosphate-sugar epimerase